MAFAPKPARTPILRVAPPTGPGWVHATIAQRTYRHRLGWAQYDLAMLAEDRIYIVRKGWKFVGARPHAPLCQVLAEGWIPRPNGLPSRAAAPAPVAIGELGVGAPGPRGHLRANVGRDRGSGR